MGWRTVVVHRHSKLSYQNNHLLYRDSSSSESVYLPDIDILLLETTDIAITTMLMKRLVDEKILVIFCDDKRLPCAQLMPYYGKHDSSLQLVKQLNWNSKAKIEVWTNIISQKILNQSIQLANYGFTDKSDSLLRLEHELEGLDPNNREGHAARIYFNCLFGNDFNRELDNDINAGLNYGYTLLMSLFAREIVCCGCMTQLGLKHSNQFNPYNLASDLMEPFRVLVDKIVFENLSLSFLDIRRELLKLFENKYLYNNKEMFLSNIVSDFTKKIIKSLDNDGKDAPEFRI